MISFACVCGGVGEVAVGVALWPWLVLLLTTLGLIKAATKQEKESGNNEQS